MRTRSGIPADFQQVAYTQGAAALPSRSKPSPRLHTESNSFDGVVPMSMDVSPGASAGDQHASLGNSGHPTPSTSSNQGSSNTSFTPPHFDDAPNPNPTQPASSTAAMSRTADQFFQSANSFARFSPQYDDVLRKEGYLGTHNPLAFQSDWDYSDDQQARSETLADHHPTSMTAGATEITPMPIPDSTWQGVSSLEGNEWMYSDWNGTAG